MDLSAETKEQVRAEIARGMRAARLDGVKLGLEAAYEHVRKRAYAEGGSLLWTISDELRALDAERIVAEGE